MLVPAHNLFILEKVKIWSLKSCVYVKVFTNQLKLNFLSGSCLLDPAVFLVDTEGTSVG